MVHLVGYGVVHAVRQQKHKHHYPADDNGIYKCAVRSGISDFSQNIIPHTTLSK